MWTSCEEPGLDCMDILVPPAMPLQLVGRVVLVPGGRLDMYAWLSRPPFRLTAEGSELDRNSMLPWWCACWEDWPDAESTEDEKDSDTSMEHLWLLFLLFHWDRSCLERLESIEAWWRVAMWRLAASSYIEMAWGVWTRGRVWLKVMTASLLWGLQGEMTSKSALERLRLSSALCWRLWWSTPSEWEVGMPGSLTMPALTCRWWRMVSWPRWGMEQEGWCTSRGGVLPVSSLDWKFPTAYRP